MQCNKCKTKKFKVWDDLSEQEQADIIRQRSDAERYADAAHAKVVASTSRVFVTHPGRSLGLVMHSSPKLLTGLQVGGEFLLSEAQFEKYQEDQALILRLQQQLHDLQQDHTQSQECLYSLQQQVVSQNECIAQLKDQLAASAVIVQPSAGMPELPTSSVQAQLTASVPTVALPSESTAPVSNASSSMPPVDKPPTVQPASAKIGPMTAKAAGQKRVLDWQKPAAPRPKSHFKQKFKSPVP